MDFPTLESTVHDRIEYKCGATKATVGLGYDATFDNEVYTQVEIYKEAS